MKSVTGLLMFFIALTFVQCNNSEDVAPAMCPDFGLVAVMPDNNPVTAPVLLKGINFTENTRVYFNQHEAESNFVSNEYITTRVPQEMTGSPGLVELKVQDENCSFTTGFRITANFEDYTRANPPDIIFPDAFDRLNPNLNFLINRPQKVRLSNIWGFNQSLIFSKVQFETQNIVEFEGIENIFSFAYFGEHKLAGTYAKSERKVSISIYHYYEFSFVKDPVPGDRLEGAFYRANLVTPQGEENLDILFLQSMITGRQYVFKANFR